MNQYPSDQYLKSAVDNRDFASLVSVEAVMVMAAELLKYRTTPPAHSAPDGWIKCSDRMPDDDTLCLGCDFDGVMWTLHFDEGQLMPDIGELSSAITYWMPLPAAPGGDE